MRLLTILFLFISIVHVVLGGVWGLTDLGVPYTLLFREYSTLPDGGVNP